MAAEGAHEFDLRRRLRLTWLPIRVVYGSEADEHGAWTHFWTQTAGRGDTPMDNPSGPDPCTPTLWTDLDDAHRPEK